MKSKLTILVVGMIAAVPNQGGWTWAILQYLIGLRELGHTVYFYEPLKRSALAPSGSSLTQSANAAYFRKVTSDFGFEQSSALVLEGTEDSVGLSLEQLRRVAQSTDILVNISGVLEEDTFAAAIPIRIYLDLDPGFTQLWHSAENIDLHPAGHTHFVTIGLGIGQDDSPIPTCGVPWITTVQPIVLRFWPMGDRLTYDGLTTVANWRGYGSIDHEGVFYGQKVHSLREFIELPQFTTENFMLALAIHPDEHRDLEALSANGWQLLNPENLVSTPSQYQSFVQGSKAEFGIAKSGYVVSRCGWFSDRSVCYLAAGRPVIAQETGFSRFLPVGEGLMTFESQDDVLASIDSLSADYPRHRRAARAIAEAYFDSDTVLTSLLRNVGAIG